MKLCSVENKPGLGYPSFDTYRANRRRFLKNLLIGVGVALAGGCDLFREKETSPLAGEIAAPHPPEGTLEPNPQVPGRPAPPQPPGKPKPVSEPVRLRGDVAAPGPPTRDLVELEGDIATPAPPEREPVALRGQIAAPEPPKRVDPPVLSGVPPPPDAPPPKPATPVK